MEETGGTTALVMELVDGPTLADRIRQGAISVNEALRIGTQIYIRPFPGPRPVVLVSAEGGNEPVWAPGAPELFCRQGDALMAVEVTTTPTLHVGAPKRLLFEGAYSRSAPLWPNYSVAAADRLRQGQFVIAGDAARRHSELDAAQMTTSPPFDASGHREPVRLCTIAPHRGECTTCGE